MHVTTAALTAVLFFHDLLTVIWVGGLITLGAVVLPAARVAFGMGPQVAVLMNRIQSRLRWLVYAAIAGLIVTGVLLSRGNPEFSGLFVWTDSYSLALSLKHVLVLVMVVIAVVRSTALRMEVPASAGAGAAVAATSPALGGATAGGAGTSAGGHGRGPDAASGGSVAGGPRFVPSRRTRVSMLLLYANIVLGIGVLFLSALTGALAT